MSTLYNIRFTTKKLVHKFDARGKSIGEPTKLANPITMTMLPHKTAMSYSGCDNFQIEQYVPENTGHVSRKGVGNGTKNVDWNAADKNKNSSGGSVKTSKPVETSAQRAAKIGDLSAAVNG